MDPNFLQARSQKQEQLERQHEQHPHAQYPHPTNYPYDPRHYQPPPDQPDAQRYNVNSNRGLLVETATAKPSVPTSNSKDDTVGVGNHSSFETSPRSMINPSSSYLHYRPYEPQVQQQGPHHSSHPVVPTRAIQMRTTNHNDSNSHENSSGHILSATSTTASPTDVTRQQHQQQLLRRQHQRTLSSNSNQKQTLLLKQRRSMYLFRAQERQLVAKFRERACLALAQQHFPAQLPALERLRDAKEQQRRQRQQQLVRRVATANNNTGAYHPPDQQQQHQQHTHHHMKPDHHSRNTTMNTLAGVASAILDARTSSDQPPQP